MLHNSRVINSNLASKPIVKDEGMGTYGKSYWERLDAYGHTWYLTKPENTDELEQPFVSNERLTHDPFRSVYGFGIPEVIKLRIVADEQKNLLKRPSQQASELMRGLGHGISLYIPREDADVTLENTYSDAIKWSVKGVAEVPQLNIEFIVNAQGVRGHAIELAGGQETGKALVSTL